MRLPKDAKERKEIPVYSGCIKYFPDALAAVAKLSKRGNDQHNPGKPLHWDRTKSGDELDAMLRHVIDEDWDAVAWRALAHLQKHIEQQKRKTEFLKLCDESIQENRDGFYRASAIAGKPGKYNILDSVGRYVAVRSGESAEEALRKYEDGS